MLPCKKRTAIGFPVVYIHRRRPAQQGFYDIILVVTVTGNVVLMADI